MTTIPRLLYWRVLALTIMAGVGLWVFALVYANNKARQERDRLCLVQYAWMVEQRAPPRLIDQLPCRPGVSGK